MDRPKVLRESHVQCGCGFRINTAVPHQRNMNVRVCAEQHAINTGHCVEIVTTVRPIKK